MASRVISMADNIHVFYKKIFEASAADDIAGDPHLILGFAYNVDGESIIAERSRNIYRFAESNPSSLQAFIREMEPLPLDTMVDPQDAEMARERISECVASLVRDCVGVEGLKRLQVDVVVEINQEDEDYALMGLDDDDDDVEFLRERRMNLVQKSVCEENEVCVICLNEMRVGEELVCTPCVHRFHNACIGSWFEKTGFCPLCRFKIG